MEPKVLKATKWAGCWVWGWLSSVARKRSEVTRSAMDFLSCSAFSWSSKLVEKLFQCYIYFPFLVSSPTRGIPQFKMAFVFSYEVSSGCQQCSTNMLLWGCIAKSRWPSVLWAEFRTFWEKRKAIIGSSSIRERVKVFSLSVEQSILKAQVHAQSWRFWILAICSSAQRCNRKPLPKRLLAFTLYSGAALSSRGTHPMFK